MFLRLIVLSLLAAVFSFPFRSDLDNSWKEYKTKFHKSYKYGEEGARRLIWEQSLARIARHNLEADMGKHSFWLGMNDFSDMSVKEFTAVMNGYKQGNKTSAGHTIFLLPFNYELPDEVDWRKEGLVTEVKNQGGCGSCWAFSSTGALEGQHKKKTGNLVELSEQNLIDCSWSEGDAGCGGGNMNLAFEYVQTNGGIDTEKSYPYEAKDDSCRYKKADVGATCTGQVSIPQGDEHALKVAVATVGPVSVAIDASLASFQSYRHGVYDDPTCNQTALDHGVLIVGYGSQNGEDYWIVKNSWGKYWGNNGYILMARNKNQCGIAESAIYPLV